MSKTNDGSDNTEKFYSPKDKIIDPEEFSVKTYLYDLGKTSQEIKMLLQMLVENQLELSNFIDDPVAKKEAALKVIGKH